jgi:hypothetical protein
LRSHIGCCSFGICSGSHHISREWSAFCISVSARVNFLVVLIPQKCMTHGDCYRFALRSCLLME